MIVPDCFLKEGQASDPGAHTAPGEGGDTLPVCVPVFCLEKSDFTVFLVSTFLELLADADAGSVFSTFL